MKYWFTSDWHLGHKNVLKLSKRPFGEISHHDETIINKCNELVDVNDTLVILGDLAWNQSYNSYKSIFQRIKCKNIIYIYGNHDNKQNILRCQKEGLITSCSDNKILNIDSDHVFISHFPYREWIGFHQGYYHLYGHCHGNISDYCKSSDCSVDCWEFEPVCWEEIKKYIDDNTGGVNDHTEFY